MRHRHLNSDDLTDPAVVEDILERGSTADWRRLASAIRADPWGRVAQALERILPHCDCTGTPILWQDWLRDVRAGYRT